MVKAVRLNSIHYPVTVLGPGRRIGIWLQGCTSCCPGCLAKDTWPGDSGSSVAVRNLVDWCRRFEPEGVDGITISGGEPFEQPEALAALLSKLRQWTDKLEKQVDYLCYTGKALRVLVQEHNNILELLDTVIPEPFVMDIPGKPLRGSGNQPLVHLTDLGRSRFAEYSDEAAAGNSKRFQLAVENKAVRFIGIPERGDMEKLRELCELQGLLLKGVSW